MVWCDVVVLRDARPQPPRPPVKMQVCTSSVVRVCVCVCVRVCMSMCVCVEGKGGEVSTDLHGRLRLGWGRAPRFEGMGWDRGCVLRYRMYSMYPDLDPDADTDANTDTDADRLGRWEIGKLGRWDDVDGHTQTSEGHIHQAPPGKSVATGDSCMHTPRTQLPLDTGLSPKAGFVGLTSKKGVGVDSYQRRRRRRCVRACVRACLGVFARCWVDAGSMLG